MGRDGIISEREKQAEGAMKRINGEETKFKIKNDSKKTKVRKEYWKGKEES